MMKGKAIYNPSGKAGEYSYWATNFYNGCSADCEYCYCKRGPLKSVWSTTPTLKKTLVDIDIAKVIFIKEAEKNIKSLREYGLFFNFTSDPFLFETIELNIWAMNYCNVMKIPVKALTKQTWWINQFEIPKNVSIGYTITGMDNMELGAATNSDRIRALDFFHNKGYTTWASVEPVIDIDMAKVVISGTSGIVDHYKIGPLSGKTFKPLDVSELIKFTHSVIGEDSTIYWKEGFIEKYLYNRDGLPNGSVSRDYKWWV